ncbi:MAG: hypothetical protein AB7G75_21600 [Candidatus Binatia bacterium]
MWQEKEFHDRQPPACVLLELKDLAWAARDGGHYMAEVRIGKRASSQLTDADNRSQGAEIASVIIDRLRQQCCSLSGYPLESLDMSKLEVIQKGYCFFSVPRLLGRH